MNAVIKRHFNPFYAYSLIYSLSVCAIGIAPVGLYAGDVQPLPQRLPDQFGGYASDQIIVQFPPGLAKAIQNRLQKKGASHKSKSVSLQNAKPVVSQGMGALMSQWGVTNIRPAYPYDMVHPELAEKYGFVRLFILDVPVGTDTPRMVKSFAAHRGEITAAGLNGIAGVGGVGGSQLIPNDAIFNKQYGMNNTGQNNGTVDADIDAPEAWAIETGFSNEVIIAIVDSGVDKDAYNGYATYHPEFAGRMVPGMNTVFGQPDDATGDNCPHGTHVAGIAAASGNVNTMTCYGGDNNGLSCEDNFDCPNSGCIDSTCYGGEYNGLGCSEDSHCPGSGCKGLGVAGVSWGAKIMPVDVLGTCNGNTSEIATGIMWAADHGANVINLSLQAYPPPQSLEATLYENAVNYAYDLNITVVCASGNFGINPIAYPARVPNCLAVGATDKKDAKWSWSNWGDDLDVMAPGVAVWSTWPNSSYLAIDGTSMATPHVAGVAALMKSLVPEATNEDIMQVIKNTADDLGAPGWDNLFGYGRVNAFNALVGISSVPQILDSVPPDGAVDARRPTDPDGSNRTGWNSVDLTFPGDVSTLLPADFRIRKIGGTVAAPGVLELIQLDTNALRVVLDDFIEVNAWTQIEHRASGTLVRIGHLPGDVDGDGMNTVNDLFELISSVNGTAKPREVWSIDLDHSGEVAPGDIATIIDLFNGAESYDPWLDASLPLLPAP